MNHLENNFYLKISTKINKQKLIFCL